MPLDPAFAKGVLDWLLVGSNVTAPGGRFLGGATGTPTGSGDSPLASNTMSFKSFTFGAANSPGASGTNNAAQTMSANSSAATLMGWNLYESSNNAGRRILYNTFTATVSMRAGSGDGMAFAAGTLSITLS